MADNLSPEIRQKNMSHIRAVNTKPEEIVRKRLFANGFRYRKNVAALPGKPDIVLPKYHTVIFVNGCFWHMHNCPRFKWPASNIEYWNQKISGNVERDRRNYRLLEALGWRVLVVWECELKKANLEKVIASLSARIRADETKEN